MKTPDASAHSVIVLTHMAPEFHAARNALGLREEPPRGPVWGSAGGRRAVGSVAGRQIRLLNSGGGEWAAAFILGSLPPEAALIWDTGSAASLGEEREPGQVVESSWVRRINGDPAWFWAGRRGQTLSLGEVPQPLRAGESCSSRGRGILSGDLFINDPERRRELYLREQGSLFAFEAWAVAEAGRCRGLPVRSLRVVTDLGDGFAPEDYRKNLSSCLSVLYRCLVHKIEEIS